MWHRFLLTLSRQYLQTQVRRRPPRPLAGLDLAQVRRVLLISATALGDTLFSTPALRALKETYPHLSLEVLGHRVFGELLSHNPHIERVWRYPGRNRRLIALARNLRRQGYDLVVILHGNDPEATMLAHLTGSPYIIGSAGSPLSFVYSASPGPYHPYEHAIERRLDYVRLLGADTRYKRMDLFLPPEAAREAEAVLAGHFGTPPPLLLALHPFGSSSYKSWPAENFAELGNHLFHTYGASLVIISGGRDRAAAEALAARLAGPSLVTGGRFGLLTAAALLGRCRLLIANDSGPLHLGLALGVPTMALLGPDHPARIGPYGADWGTYLYKKEEVCAEEPCLTKKCPENLCLKAIQVAEVVELLKTWWEPHYLGDRDQGSDGSEIT
jgi:ADP-heptose:LPS heptosyltransferase